MPAYYDEVEGYGGGPRSMLSTIGKLGGIVVCLGAIAGGAIYLSSEGPSTPGEIPVIRAEAGPAKTAPAATETAARHSDVTAFEVAEGIDQLRPQGTMPASEGPNAEDLPMSQIAAVTTLPTARFGPDGGAVASRQPNGAATSAPRPISHGGASQQVAALHLSPDGGYTVPGALSPPRVQRLITSEAELLSVRRPLRMRASADEPFPPRGEGSPIAPPVSPFVRQRPQDLAERFAGAGDAAQEAEAALVRAAETSQVQIQLGAYPERAKIEAEWARLRTENSDVLAGRALAVQQTVSGGAAYYRLRVGPFRDGLEASTVCQALKARGYDCLVAINTERRG